MIDKLSPADVKWVEQARADFIQRVDGKEIAALRARVAKLEAALQSIWEQDDGGMGRIARAALQDAPQ